MKKTDSLRDYLSRAIPELQDASRFQVFIDKGVIRSTGVPSAGGVIAFEYAYTCNLLMLDFAGDQNAVAVAVVAWLAVNQSESLHNADRNRSGIAFECDILDDRKVDLQLTLELTERIGATPRIGGGFDLIAWSEPVMAGVEAWADGPAKPPLIGSIWAGGELIAELPGD
ncbi:phage tail protein [Brevundimonas nasdae]|uniref:phage tail protein n=1 Tax=Brevundimonas nasdae TaxID=172043 RepID=UPI003F6913B6